MWNKVKKMFKRKKKRSPTVLNDFSKLEQLPSNMRIQVSFRGKVKGQHNMFMWEVNGVMLQAEDIISAQRKYLRNQGIDHE